MTYDTLFSIANLGVLPFWLLLTFVPRQPWAVRIVRSPLGFVMYLVVRVIRPSKGRGSAA